VTGLGPNLSNILIRHHDNNKVF